MGNLIVTTKLSHEEIDFEYLAQRQRSLLCIARTTSAVFKRA